jgi:hypothetical protein
MASAILTILKLLSALKHFKDMSDLLSHIDVDQRNSCRSAAITAAAPPRSVMNSRRLSRIQLHPLLLAIKAA